MKNSNDHVLNAFNMNWQMSAYKKVQYQVSLVRGLLDTQNDLFAKTCGANGQSIVSRLIVIDEVVFQLYEKKFNHYFDIWKIKPHWKVISGGEQIKTMEQVYQVADAMIESGVLRRSEAVIAVGGGVVLDIVGFAASLYRRGIPYIRIPTTLMGQIDAGIGVKTGVNYGSHKNRLGTYHEPQAALIDPTFLKTLDQRHIANGVAEIIKMALIKDKRLFELLEDLSGRLNNSTLSKKTLKVDEVFYRAIDTMLEELEPNLWEAVLKRSVDYGHTFSPSLELIANPSLLHGEAVSIDMALSTILAFQRNLLTAEEVERVLRLLVDQELPISHTDFNLELVVKALGDSIKHRDGYQHLPLMNGIGKVIFVNDLQEAELNGALNFLNQYAAKLNGQNEAA